MLIGFVSFFLQILTMATMTIVKVRIPLAMLMTMLISMMMMINIIITDDNDNDNDDHTLTAVSGLLSIIVHNNSIWYVSKLIVDLIIPRLFVVHL